MENNGAQKTRFSSKLHHYCCFFVPILYIFCFQLEYHPNCSIVETCFSCNNTILECIFCHRGFSPFRCCCNNLAHLRGADTALSLHEIKEIEFCKKCPKVKPYCGPIFDPFMLKLFWMMQNQPNFVPYVFIC